MDSESSQLAALQRRFERLSLLYQVSNVIHSSLDPKEALDLILHEAVRLTRASSGSIALINPVNSFLEMQACSGLPGDAEHLKLRVGEGITGSVASTGTAARVGDVRADPRYIMVRAKAQSELAVPLHVSGEVRGVINVDSDRLNAFSPEDESLLMDLSVQAAKVIHKTWLYEQLRLKARLFESLFSVGQTINSTLNLDEALQVITREAALLMEAKLAAVLLLDESREWLHLRASYGAGPAYLRKPRLSVSESLLGIVVRRRKPVQVDNVQTSTRYQSVDIAQTEGLVSLLSVPLIFQQEAIGTLSVYTHAHHSFSNEEIRILSALAELSGVAIEKARLYERIADMEEQLRQTEKLSAIGLLAAEVAHEIRNPLTVIKMLFHSLELQFPDSDPRNRDVEVIRQKMDLLNRIVEQVLDLARNTEPKPAWIKLNDLIADISLLVRHKLHHQQIELQLDLQPDLPLVHADAPQLEQAFLNLILNAVEAMPKGGRLTISTTTFDPVGAPATLRVAFTDTGEGMTAEQQRRVFSSLLSTSKARGTGLGLAIVSKIIEAHQGSLQIQSALGKGTTVNVCLPR